MAKKIKEMSLVCDKFHFRNHVDRWCKANCNPFTTTELEVNVFEMKHKLKKQKWQIEMHNNVTSSNNYYNIQVGHSKQKVPA